MDIAQLQNLCRRDPQGYKEDFLLQKGHFDSQLKIYLLKPSKNFEEFEKQIKFLSHVAPYYKSDMTEFPHQLAKLLEEKCDLMESRLRRGIVGSLILLRNRGLYKAVDLLSLCFKLFRVHDKLLREMLYSHIITDIKRVNKKNKSNSLNNTLQSFMFGVMTNADSSLIAAKKSLDIMIELYRKKIWNDAKTVNAISLGMFSKNTKLVTATLKFFLNATSKTTADASDEEDDKEEEEEAHKERLDQISDLRKKIKSGSKKSKGKQKKLQQTLDRLRKQDKTVSARVQYNFPAIDLLYDAQSYCERVFNVLKKSTERFEVRLMMMNFVSRLIGHHKLFVENFYPFLINYMHPKQEHITYILAILCQACHDLVSPDTLEPVIRVLSMNFVSDRCSPEVMSIGINTIREICTRCPLAMTAELLQDLAMYKNLKDKGVVMAARSLINYFRQTNPQLLHRKDRGKGTNLNVRPLDYGEVRPSTGVEGIELLEEYERLKQEEDVEQEEGWEGWELASNDSDGPDVNDEGWVEVNSDDEEEEDEEDMENANDDNDNKEEEVDNEEEENEEEDNDEEEEEDETASTVSSIKGESLKDRILTQEELDKIRELKERKQIESATGLSRKRKQPERVINTSEDVSEIVNPSDLEGFTKHVRKTKEERMASIIAGREGRHFGSKKGNREDKPTTNKEKLSAKPFMLVRYSKEISKKKNMTTRQKQKAKRQHRLNQKNQLKYKH